MIKSEVGIREAKINLSRLIKEVKNGREILITERGVPVARLATLGKGDVTLEEKISRLQKNGFIGEKSGHTRKMPQPLPIKDNKAQLFLTEDRNR